MKRCPGCGRVYTAAEFISLPMPPKGGWQPIDGAHGLMLRNCCGYTMAMQSVRPPRRARGQVHGLHPRVRLAIAFAVAGIHVDLDQLVVDVAAKMRARFAPEAQP